MKPLRPAPARPVAGIFAGKIRPMLRKALRNVRGANLCRAIPAALLLLLSAAPAVAQQKVYFVDGYHGGIYGHYPVAWKTRFITEELIANPEWRIGLEIEPETWDTVQMRTPADYARFKSLTTDPRVEFTNPTYAQPYCYNISGESIIRQLAYGIRKIHNHFPEVRFTTYSVEEPCFTSCLPQILKLFGFKYASLKCPNTCWGGYTAAYGGETVNWIGPDGSSLLASPRYACEELQKNSVWQTTAWGNETEYLDACRAQGIAHPVGMCYQDAGWKYGPWIGRGDTIRNHSIYVTWREYFEQITDGKSSDDYHFSQEDVHASLMWGSQVLQRIARQVRRSENELLAAEKMGVIANLTDGYTYNQAILDEAWRTLMLSQHHDSWIVPYNGLHNKGTWADHIARWTASTDSLCGTVIAQAQQSFRQDGGGEGLYLRISNTLGMPRCETVSVTLPDGFGDKAPILTDAGGKKIETSLVTGPDGRSELLFRADVPAFGYATYRIEKGRKALKTPAATAIDPKGGCTLENDLYRIEIDPARGGVIRSLTAKKEGKKEFADLRSDYALGELRGYFYEQGRFRSSTETPAEVSWLRNDALEKSVRICGRIASHPFTQTITLREGDRKIDFDLKIDWQHDEGIGEFRQTDGFNNNRRAFYDDRYKLCVYFPVGLQSPALYKDAPFDVCKSQLSDTYFSTWDAIKHNVILHWTDLTEGDDGYGFALLTDHTTSYSNGPENPLALTVQYSGNGLWGRNYIIDRPTHIRFAVLPHREAWDAAGIDAESRRWNEPLRCTLLAQTTLEDRSLIDLRQSGYVISAACMDGSDIILRLFNASGDDTPQRIACTWPVSEVEEIDLNGRTVAACEVQHKDGRTEIETRMPRFGLKTFRLTK